MWPDAGIKINPHFPILANTQKWPKYLFYKVTCFKIAQKVSKYLGNFNGKICCLELLKITQSGHTDADPMHEKWFCFLLQDVDMLLDELQMIDLERKEVRLTRSLEDPAADNSAKSFDAQWLRDTQGDVTSFHWNPLFTALIAIYHIHSVEFINNVHFIMTAWKFIWIQLIPSMTSYLNVFNRIHFTISESI